MRRDLRCTERNKDGQQCKHKAKHESTKDDNGDVKFPKHSAFGKQW